MSKDKNFRANDVVTWGTGAPRARIDGFEEAFDEMSNGIVRLALLTLTADLHTPCGAVGRAGLQIDMPVSELRRVH